MNIVNSGAKIFNSHSEIANYYDDRFDSNYMEGWDKYIEVKIRTFFSQFELPLGSWLDFGCGQGSLTGLLSDIHPCSKVEGADISSVAVQKASERNAGIPFWLWDKRSNTKKYDLIFSHHVLEHVLNLEETLDALDSMTGESGLHCHILPCGNEGSLEWKVANNTQLGFENNGRFFFEEDGHLRRLTSQQLIQLYAARGYRVVSSQFSNQYHGALKWLTDMGPGFICDFANPKRGKSSHFMSSIWLYSLRFRLLLLWRARYLTDNKPQSHWKKRLYPFLRPFIKGYAENFYKNLKLESKNSLSNPAASEMLICFAKSNSVETS